MKPQFSSFCSLLVFAAIAHAHFVFVVPEPGGASAKLFLSETLQPDSKVGVAMVSGTKLALRESTGRDVRLEITTGPNSYLVALPGSGTRLIHGLTDLGFAENHAGAKPFLLLYHPKTIVGDAFETSATLGGEIPIEIVPVGKPGSLRLTLLVRGKPQPNAEMMVILPDGSQKKMKTDELGRSQPLSEMGRFGAWARYWEPTSGQRDGKKYEELHHYATLVFDTSAGTSTSERPAITAMPFASLPEASASLGAVADRGWLYVYGGHVARTHSYSTEAVSGRFSRMNLSAPGKWEELPSGPALQGMNLAAFKGKIYRVGGMEPRNQPGQPAENFSVADVARYDPASKEWEALPSLPEPRSSHDVVVIGEELFVTAGWNMKGKAGQSWAGSTWLMDLAAKKLEWKTVPQPFQRRALIAAAHMGKMYVMGGIDPKGKISSDVDIYNAGTGVWSKGPALPGTGVGNFAPASAVHNGQLYVSLADGALYRLNESKQQWELCGRGTPRVAHRMVSNANILLVLGGANRGQNLDLIEAIDPIR